jgi:D-alanyl-D-alanine carboxypeptidase
MRLADHMRVGSVTKSVTVMAILQLVDKGKLRLDDPISRYVADVPNGKRITIRHLAGMTSGLYDYVEDSRWQAAAVTHMGRTWTPRQLLAVSFRHHPSFPPGKGAEYSSTNTILLGLVIQKVTGMAVQQVFRQRIFGPLRMTHTSLPSTALMPAPYAHGYSNQTLNGKIGDVTSWNPSWGWTAGAMVSTLDDLYRWAGALGQGSLLSPRLRQARLQGISAGHSSVYALGVAETNGWRWHNGNLPGYSAYVGYLPSMGARLVVLANSDVTANGQEPADVVARELSRVVMPKQLAAP